MRPLNVGIVLPHLEGEHGGATPRWRDLLTMARRAEAIGLDSIWVPDHLLFGSPGEPALGAWEGWSLLAALAAATTRVELGTLIVNTAFRNPALLAKMADTVDEISGGRLILGLGSGYGPAELRAFGYPPDHLVGRFAEALAIIRALLRGETLDHRGTYHQIAGCTLRPRGPRPQGPPILVGATGDRMLRLTATHADLWNEWLAFGRSRPDAIPPLRARVDDACAAVGRDPATLGRTVAVMVRFPLSGARPIGPGEEAITGTPEAIAETIRGFAREGISHLQVWPEPNTVAGVDALGPVLAALDASG